MFERFTDRARKVMALANQEAQRFNHEYIAPEHVLLAIIKEGSGIASNSLLNLGVDPRRVRLEVEKLIKSGPEMLTMGKLPQTPECKIVIAKAIEAARSLKNNYVGTEHLILGLFHGEHIAATVLKSLGLDEDKMRAEIVRLVGEKNSPVTVNIPGGTWTVLKTEVDSHERVWDAAKQCARLLNTLTDAERESALALLAARRAS